MSTTDINAITLSGRLVRDPQLRHVADGRAVCDLRIAVNGADAAPRLKHQNQFGVGSRKTRLCRSSLLFQRTQQGIKALR